MINQCPFGNLDVSNHIYSERKKVICETTQNLVTLYYNTEAILAKQVQ